MTDTFSKKLIEVALPLAAINEGSKPETENPFLKGHPRAIHNWWARTPLSVSRAILFAQLIDDPGNGLETEEAQRARRELLDFVAKLATWEATTDEKLIEKAREIILKQFKGKAPEFWDMFAGRASIPLEAQRLGLKVTSSDLNPVAVTIQRGLLEFPSTFSGSPPVHPQNDQNLLHSTVWKGATGLADDIRWYGKWVCQEAQKRLSKLYPKGPDGNVVVAWLWTRTVPSPDPSRNGAAVPLVRSFKLAGKKRHVWVFPKVNRKGNNFEFDIANGIVPEVKGTVSRKGATCLLSKNPMPFPYVRKQAKQGNMGTRLMAIVTEGNRGKFYHAPSDQHISAARQASPKWRPDCEMPKKHRNFQPPVYGMENIGDLFTPRQLVALDILCDIILDARKHILEHAKGNTAYAEAVTFYLACALSRMTDYHSNLTTWNPTNENVSHLFQRQAIPMAWDFCEANPIEGKLAYDAVAGWVASSLESLPTEAHPARVKQADARQETPSFGSAPVVSTDPPYYDNISYADLADFFYVWLRRILKSIDPHTFATLLTPKGPELIASPTRHGSLELAEKHFRHGFQNVFAEILQTAEPSIPCTIYYAFKQEEEEESSESPEGGNRVSTGWETMLEGLVEAGFQITGTWPVRTTKKARAVAKDANALASAIVLVARKRSLEAPHCSRRELLNELKRKLPSALKHLQQGNVAPVDLAQASIGPGMAIFSQYSKVIESRGRMTVRTALSLINQTLDEVLSEQEAEFDTDTRWCLAWFEQHGMKEGLYGDAETLSKAKNTAVNGLVEAGVVFSRGGKVRLLDRNELPEDWDPAKDKRLTVWEITQHLIYSLEKSGESGAAELLSKLGSGAGEAARELSYRLFQICEKNSWSKEALSYNGLVVAWPEIVKLATTARPTEQGKLI
ncbi:MAG: DUF1156 domain-containing protein [Candidatus Abyssobacteria bacterium SURF_5]|uniref:DUF1156 domain-containing protein n=1 Tax=Abyssobacteria bacterium (strain SURF_5) TaxID=2093360 RepID=A0A3A4P4T2_ABYX5|nr:MAG: DUF1156 domain-containing protein [Candidatus Abyssubacteria bacterium SURF_5]